MNDKYNVNNTAVKKSDWNANEGESGFIKNRTHYEKVTEETISTTVNVPSEWEKLDYAPEYICYTETVDDDFEQSLHDVFIADAENTGGQAVYHSSGKIRINGTEYDCYWYIDVYMDGDILSYWRVHCFDSADMSFDGDFPFQNLYFSIDVEKPGDLEESVGILYNTNYIPIGENSIELTTSKTEVKKIDEKFLPEMSSLKNIKDAENGGIIEGLVEGEDGQVNVASGMNAHAEGQFTEASGDASHAEGSATTALGEDSHAEGGATTASGDDSHAEGQNTIASGGTSHAEGTLTTASGDYSHAEGQSTTASGAWSHAEGGATTASGDISHAEGSCTIANHKSQHVFGEFNIADPSTNFANQRGNYVEIVGNGGYGNPRSNARTLDWSGNEWLAGSITPVGGLILTSPDGSLFTLTVANDGTLSATKQTN